MKENEFILTRHFHSLCMGAVVLVFIALSFSGCTNETIDGTFGGENTYSDGNESLPPLQEGSGDTGETGDTGGTGGTGGSGGTGGTSGGTGNTGGSGPSHSYVCDKSGNKAILDRIVKAEVDLKRIDLSDSTLATPNKRIDLLQLESELNANLDAATVPAGVHGHLQLIVENGIVTLDDGTQYELKTPSGDESGIKLELDPVLFVTIDGTVKFNIEINIVCQIVVRGNTDGTNFQGFLFKPVVHLKK